MKPLVCYYDLFCCPTSYDIVSFLMLIERHRHKMGADSCIIRIIPGPDHGFRASVTWPMTVEDKRMMLNQVVVPMIRMLPSCEHWQVCERRPDMPSVGSIGWMTYSMSFKEFGDTYAMGIRPLRCKEQSWKLNASRPLVTMTLREAEHWPERNSRTAEWMEAALRLRAEGVNVVLVRDAAKKHVASSLPEVPDASTDLNVRAVLYAQADLNMFVNNGPAWFCMALDAPTVVLKPITETSCSAHTYKAMAHFGIHKDKQMAGAPPHQRLVWQDDTADNIVAAAHDFLKQKAEAA